jgi:alpha-1,2-mannosyltransferase
MVEDRSRRFPTVFLALLVVAAVVSVVLLLTFPRETTEYWGLLGGFVDVHVYRWGGEYVLAGRDLYADLLRASTEDVWRYPMPWTYTPFAALLFVPLQVFSASMMEALWLLGTLAAMVAVARLMWTWLGYRPGRRLTVVSVAVAALMLFTEPVRMTLWLGQINVLLLLLLVWDASRPAGSRLRGAATGIAAGIKLTPAFLWFHYVVTRQWRCAAVSVGTFVVTVLVGAAVAPGSSLHYWSGGMFEGQRIGHVDAPSNQSVYGVLAWYVFHGPVPTWAWLIGASLAALVGLAVAWYLHRRGLPQLSFVVSGMTGAVASPFSWGHHWVWFLPLMVVLLDLLLRHARAGWARAAWLLPPALYFFVGAWTQSFPDDGQPDGRWVGTGWFMTTAALEGPVAPLLREPYLVVWAATLVLGVLAARRLGSADAPGTPDTPTERRPRSDEDGRVLARPAAASGPRGRGIGSAGMRIRHGDAREGRPVAETASGSASGRSTSS